MTAALLLAAALATAGAGADSQAARPRAPGSLRWIAAAGPSYVSKTGNATLTGFDLCTGLEAGSNRYLRFVTRLDTHILRRNHASTHATTLIAGAKVQMPSQGVPVVPYVYAAIGYGTAESSSDFVLPAAAEAGAGLRMDLPGGQELFLEVGAVGANERRFTAVRLGVLIP